MNLQSIANFITDEVNLKDGFEYDCQPIAGEVEILQVTVIGREELPIFLSVTDDQIICMVYLFGTDEVVDDAKKQKAEDMIKMNIPMPLSSFDKIGEQYVIFGALSLNSSMEDIQHELSVLSDNSLEAINAMTDFLK
jgi:uncharacterized protein YjfI (DUF2170 family)